MITLLLFILTFSAPSEAKEERVCRVNIPKHCKILQTKNSISFECKEKDLTTDYSMSDLFSKIKFPDKIIFKKYDGDHFEWLCK